MKKYKKIISTIAVIAIIAGAGIWASTEHNAHVNRASYASQIHRRHLKSHYHKHTHHQSASQRIHHQINHMSWRQKVGQLFVGDGIPNNNAQAKYLVHHYNLGGTILDGNNMQGNVRRHTHSMEDASHHSLLIGTDQEGGQVSRLGYNPYKYPSPQQAYRRGGMKGVYRAYHYSDWKLHKLGINWNYAPDADNAHQGSYMYFRAIGHGTKRTSQFVKTAVPAIQHQHVAATLKHFPGYGDARQDTDFNVVKSNRSMRHLQHYDFPPFKAGIHQGADSVMVTNIILNEVQRNVPATLSRQDINLLRNKLHFHGVIVTDSLDAVAVRDYCHAHGVSADYQAIKAGNDMIMARDFRKAIPRLTHDVKSGKLSKSQVNHDVYHVLEMKHKLGLNY